MVIILLRDQQKKIFSGNHFAEGAAEGPTKKIFSGNHFAEGAAEGPTKKNL